MALSGATLYLDGTFTKVGGASTDRLAAVDRTTGTRNAGFDPEVAGQVSALALSGATLYAGGAFTTVNGGVARNALAGFDASSGVVDPQLHPSPNSGATISALLASGARLHAGGTFTTMGPSLQLQVARFAIAAPVIAPAVVTAAASAITTTGAAVAGTVDPNARATQYVFEYGPTLSFGAITPPDDAGLGDADVPLTAALSGLSPNTTTYYRLVASSSAGTTPVVVRSFRTSGSPQPPIAITGAASAFTNGGATLAGQVNPRGQLTAYTIEYGRSTAFGAIAPVVALDDADALEPVSATLTGLTADTTYYYRRRVQRDRHGVRFGRHILDRARRPADRDDRHGERAHGYERGPVGHRRRARHPDGIHVRVRAIQRLRAHHRRRQRRRRQRGAAGRAPRQRADAQHDLPLPDRRDERRRDHDRDREELRDRRRELSPGIELGGGARRIRRAFSGR
jgi:hypothetical protein